MKKQLAEELLQKYIEGKCTEHEKALVETWYLKHNLGNQPYLSSEDRNQDLDDIWDSIHNSVVKKRRQLRRWYSAVAAAAILLAVCTAGFIIFSTDKEDSDFPSYAVAQDVQPGGNSATLTLSDGSRIVLDSIGNGEVVSYNGVRFIKSSDGQLICETTVVDSENLEDYSNTYNTIETPMGGQYQVILPDGTNVWLNAASSIKYPVVFDGKERNVELTGEAYFDVAKNPEKPFKLKVNDTYVEVLGTQFNVTAYKGERTINTTLLEGKVKVSKGNLNQTISPGQQTRIGESGQIQVISNIDTEEVVAWKNGTFNFNNTDLKTVMRQLERWYNVEIDEDGMPQKRFNGIISRNVPLSQVLKMMEVTSGLKFNIENTGDSQDERRVIMAK